MWMKQWEETDAKQRGRSTRREKKQARGREVDCFGAVISSLIKLADDYREARKQVENNRGGDFSQKGKQSPSAPEEFELAKGSSKEKHRQRQRWSEDLPVTCFNCIKCGHSDLRHPTNCRSMFSVYPVSNLNLEVGGVPVSVKAAVFKTLQVYVLLGTDVPELGRLLGVTPKNMEENGRKLRSTDGVHQSWC
eukprot:Em0024g12a